jgi:hypothetical protein
MSQTPRNTARRCRAKRKKVSRVVGNRWILIGRRDGILLEARMSRVWERIMYQKEEIDGLLSDCGKLSLACDVHTVEPLRS